MPIGRPPQQWQRHPQRGGQEEDNKELQAKKGAKDAINIAKEVANGLQVCKVIIHMFSVTLTNSTKTSKLIISQKVCKNAKLIAETSCWLQNDIL